MLSVRTLYAFIFSLLIALSPVLAQQAQNPDPASPPTAQKLSKEQKKKMGRALKELDAQYKQWLSEDVVYIITAAERQAFQHLNTDAERDQMTTALHEH